MTQRRICKFFLRGCCQNGSGCKFEHVKALRFCLKKKCKIKFCEKRHESKECYFYANSKCRFPTNCWYVHSPRNTSVAVNCLSTENMGGHVDLENTRFRKGKTRKKYNLKTQFKKLQDEVNEIKNYLKDALNQLRLVVKENEKKNSENHQEMDDHIHKKQADKEVQTEFDEWSGENNDSFDLQQFWIEDSSDDFGNDIQEINDYKKEQEHLKMGQRKGSPVRETNVENYVQELPEKEQETVDQMDPYDVYIDWITRGYWEKNAKDIDERTTRNNDAKIMKCSNYVKENGKNDKTSQGPKMKKEQNFWNGLKLNYSAKYGESLKKI